MNKSRNVLLSALIRKRRKELNWKQESLINGIPISVSYYSEIERGNRAIPSDLLNSLLEKLQLPLLSDIWYADFSNKINLLKKYLYYCKHNEINKIYCELDKEKKRLNNSLLFLEYNLAMFMYESSYIHKVVKERTELLEEYSNFLSEEQLYIYKLYKGILEKHMHHPEIALISFKELLKTNVKFRYYTELLYYHTAICYIQKGYFVLAQEMNKEAEILFLKEHNLYRLAYTMMHECIIYTQENHYEKAETIYDNLLDDCYNLSSRALNTILCNAGINSIKAQHYQKAIDYYKKLKPDWQQIPEIFYGISLALLQMEDNEGLDHFIEYSKGFPKNKFIDDVISIIDLQRKPECNRELEAKLKACEKYLQHQGDAEGLIFVYEQLIQYYETRSIVKQVKYLKKLNELNKRGMQYEQ